MGTVNQNDMYFVRTLFRHLPPGIRCNACVAPPDQAGEILVVNCKNLNLYLCPFHEGQLLEKLLTNYIKRKKRGSKVGFIAGISKESLADV